MSNIQKAPINPSPARAGRVTASVEMDRLGTLGLGVPLAYPSFGRAFRSRGRVSGAPRSRPVHQGTDWTQAA